jgi:hypothetical protein
LCGSSVYILLDPQVFVTDGGLGTELNLAFPVLQGITVTESWTQMTAPHAEVGKQYEWKSPSISLPSSNCCSLYSVSGLPDGIQMNYVQNGQSYGQFEMYGTPRPDSILKGATVGIYSHIVATLEDGDGNLYPYSVTLVVRPALQVIYSNGVVLQAEAGYSKAPVALPITVYGGVGCCTVQITGGLNTWVVGNVNQYPYTTTISDGENDVILYPDPPANITPGTYDIFVTV